MRVRTDIIWGCFLFFVLVIALSWMDKGLFVVSEYTGEDAFFVQMSPFLDGVKFSSLESLQYIHFFRFLVISPFIVGSYLELGAGYSAFILFLFSLPILKINKRGLFNYFKYIILLIPIFVSFRSFLVACAIAYLFIAIYHHKSYFLLLSSLFIATLSSGVVLVWLLIFLINIRLVTGHYRLLTYGLFVMVVVVFLPSIMHKIAYSESELEGFQDYFLRGTLVVSFMEGQWARFVFYMSIVVVLLFIAVRSLFLSKLASFYLSYVAVLVGVVFEGLGLLCGMIIIIMFFLGFVPNHKFVETRVRYEKG